MSANKQHKNQNLFPDSRREGSQWDRASAHPWVCPESHAVLLRTFAEPPEYILSQLKKAGVGVAPESFIYYS